MQDHGPGLPVSEQERIWQRFYRADGIGVQSGSGIGLGLGLYICKRIIEGHKGTVGLDSVVGHGSTFWFTLPLPLWRSLLPTTYNRATESVPAG